MSSYRPGRDTADDYNDRRRGYDRDHDYRGRREDVNDSYEPRDRYAHNSRGGRDEYGNRDRREHDRRHRSRSRSPIGDRRRNFRDRDTSQPRRGLNYYDEEPQEVEPYDGAEDVDTDYPSSNLVLIRNLKPTLNKDILAKALERVCWSEESPTGADPAMIHRIFLIHSRVTDRGMGFGFVQFHGDSDAIAAVKKAKELGDKCTVSSQRMMLDYAKTARFRPTVSANDGRMAKKYSIQWGSGEPFYYYREDLYPTELVINASPPARPAQDASSPPDAADPNRSTAGVAGQGKLSGPAGSSVWDDAKAGTRVTIPKLEREQTFTIDHPAARVCLLCWKQFGRSKTLPQHVKYSDIHAGMMADPAAVAQGWRRMKEFRIDPTKTLQCGRPVRAAVEPIVDEAIKAAPLGKVSFSLKGAAAAKKG